MIRTTMLALAFLVLTAPASRGAEPWSGRTVLVTGANRGLGLEFARQLAAAGATVIATARTPADAGELAALGVRVEQLDVTDAASVDALAERLGDTALDVLINNAGRFSWRGGFAELDPEDARADYDVNVLGTLRVSQALLPHLKRGAGRTVMNLSSGLGSIDNAGGGGSAGYRASKAALNMLTVVMAAELKDDGFLCVAMSPGWVRTDMGGPDANLSPEESVRGMLATLAAQGRDGTGRYLNHDGRELPW